MDAWRRERYLLHARSMRHRRARQRAIEAVQEAMRHVPGVWAASVSGGKDSTAMVAMAVEAGWRGPLLHIRYPETPDENVAAVYALGARYDLPVHVIDVPGAWDVYDAAGRFFEEPETAEEQRATRDMLREYKRRAAEYVASQGWTGQLLGMRAQESRRRKMALGRKGVLYRTSDRETWTCCPLAWWQAEDVLAVLCEYDLPILSVYARSDNPESQRSEMTWLAEPTVWAFGGMAVLRRHHPDLFERLAARYPAIRRQT